jgi:hypothetical protein
MFPWISTYINDQADIRVDCIHQIIDKLEILNNSNKKFKDAQFLLFEFKNLLKMLGHEEND